MATDYYNKKDPNEIKDWSIDWSNEVDGQSASISTSTWLTPTPETDPSLDIVSGSEANTSTATSVKLEGGKVGIEYKITNRITTTDGITADSSLEILVVEK